MSAPELVLVAPGLLALAPEALAGHAALARVAASGDPMLADDLDLALLAALGVDAPVAPLAALGAGLAPGDRFTIRADPVSMRVTHEDVRIDARVDDLDDEEASLLRRTLDAHFGADGIAFHAPRRDVWFATVANRRPVATTPLDAAIGRTLRPCLPGGPDAARWRRWLTEAQMLLHEHPLARRARPVNGIWFSGGGVLGSGASEPTGEKGAGTGPGIWATLVAAAGRDGDLARGLARRAGRNDVQLTSLADALAPARDSPRRVVVLQRVGPASDPPSACAPVAEAMRALDDGTIARLRLIADGLGLAATWSIERPSSWRRWVPRRARFVPPQRSE